MSTLKERFELLQAERPGIKQADLVRATGAKASSVNAWFSGDTKSMKPETAALAAAIYEVNPLWLATGKGPKTGFNLANLQYAGAHVTTSPGPSPVPAPGMPGIPVPMLDNAASMGGGSDALSEDVLAGQIRLAPSFVHDYIRPSSPDALRFIHGYGDSMHPTFNSGDVLLVDTGVREPRIDGIYVLQAHGRLFIKRVRQRMDGSHEISSDNPVHKTVDTLNGDHVIDVLGRVVCGWNGRKF